MRGCGIRIALTKCIMRISAALLPSLLVFLVASSSLAENPEAALRRFRAEMWAINDQAVKMSTEDHRQNEKRGMADSIFEVRKVVKRMSAVPTGGLPEDLKSTFEQTVDTQVKMMALFADWPQKAEDWEVYLRIQAAVIPDFWKDLSGKMKALMKENEDNGRKLAVLSKKYGFEYRSADARSAAR
jgi:hypothetical protein